SSTWWSTVRSTIPTPGTRAFAAPAHATRSPSPSSPAQRVGSRTGSPRSPRSTTRTDTCCGGSDAHSRVAAAAVGRHGASATPHEPSLQLGDPRADLIAGGLGDSGSPARLPQLHMDGGVRLARPPGPRAHEGLQPVPILLECTVLELVARGLRIGHRDSLTARLLLRLVLAQQLRHLLGLQEARDPDEVRFVLRPDRAARAELAAVEQHLVEARLCVESFEGAQQ